MSSERLSRKKNIPSFSFFFKKSISRVFSIINQKFTVMLIPHSEKKVVNFQISVLLLFFVVTLMFGMVGAFFYMTTMYSGSQRMMTENEQDLAVSQGNLDSVLEEVNDVVKMYEIFEGAMNNTLSELDLNSASNDQITAGGDLSSLSDLQEISNGEVREVYDLIRLRESLSEAVEPLEDISQVLQVERQLLSDIPTLWPVASGRTAVTMEFGPNIHPVHGNWYLHKGIDIAGPQGLPIRAAANGRVLESGLDQISGYGNYIIIEHKYGFKTRYSHMQNRLVRAGDTVAQGQRIGALGDTGLSTGAHLDFQIMLGTEVLDPASFLNIKNNFTRWIGGRGY